MNPHISNRDKRPRLIIVCCTCIWRLIFVFFCRGEQQTTTTTIIVRCMCRLLMRIPNHSATVPLLKVSFPCSSLASICEDCTNSHSIEESWHAWRAELPCLSHPVSDRSIKCCTIRLASCCAGNVLLRWGNWTVSPNERFRISCRTWCVAKGYWYLTNPFKSASEYAQARRGFNKTSSAGTARLVSTTKKDLPIVITLLCTPLSPCQLPLLFLPVDLARLFYICLVD